MKNKISFLNMKSKFNNEKQIGGRRNLYNSLWALFFGIFASIIVISITGNNPFEVFGSIFSKATGNNVDFITTMSVFIIATIGIGMCFKTGIFNIGISGQMMAGGMTTVLILKLIGINGGTIFLAILLATLSGAIVSLIAGVLKSFLKVNEVVSTILLNWIIFYVIKFIIFSDIVGLVSEMSLTDSRTEAFNLPIFFTSDAWLAILSIFVIILVISTWFIFSKTTIGYKIKMLAANKDASKYSGTNEKIILLSVITISGAFAGFAGFLFYSEIGSIQAGIEPISIGFDTIAIALLAYNNPIGIGISSFFFTIINLGCKDLESQFAPLNEDFAQIMFGIIIYISAIGIVFNKFKIYTKIKNNYIYWKDKTYKEELNKYKTERKNIFLLKKENYLKIKNIKLEKKSIWKDIKEKSIKKKEILEEKLGLKNKKLEDLSQEKQEYYFNNISLIKKEKDEQLFKNDYFEILKIKSSTKILEIDNKNNLKEKQKQILLNYESEKNIQKQNKQEKILKGGQ